MARPIVPGCVTSLARLVSISSSVVIKAALIATARMTARIAMMTARGDGPLLVQDRYPYKLSSGQVKQRRRARLVPYSGSASRLATRSLTADGNSISF